MSENCLHGRLKVASSMKEMKNCLHEIDVFILNVSCTCPKMKGEELE